MTLRDYIPTVHPEGRNFVAISFVVSLVAFLIDWTAIGWLLLLLTGAIALFFRDPVRQSPQGDGLVLAPADGAVVAIVPARPPLDGPDGAMACTRVSIFLSVFDVHINRAPVAGTVARIVYRPGTFVNADLDKASEDNERQTYLIETAGGVRVVCVQIAGLIARRIVRFVKEGDTVRAGQRIGLIRFGSRMDVYLPEGTAPKVSIGQRTVAGETVIAVLGDAMPISAVAD